MDRRAFLRMLATAVAAPGVLLSACGPEQPTFSLDAGTIASRAGTLAESSGPLLFDAGMQIARNRNPFLMELSIAKLLRCGIEPVGAAMYVWGGGWNGEGGDFGIEATTIGVSPRWAEFAAQQDSSYDFNATAYQSHDGLDCSGYMGWAVYNALEHESNANAGYVSKGEAMAGDLAARGLGDFTPAGQVDAWQAGDIGSTPEHVWMAVGQCADGSIVVLHCSPPGVFLCGTLTADSNYSQATDLADSYMNRFYPSWIERYGNRVRPYEYLTTSSRMRWSDQVLPDPQGLRAMDAAGVLEFLYATR